MAAWSKKHKIYRNEYFGFYAEQILSVLFAHINSNKTCLAYERITSMCILLSTALRSTIVRFGFNCIFRVLYSTDNRLWIEALCVSISYLFTNNTSILRVKTVLFQPIVEDSSNKCLAVILAVNKQSPQEQNIFFQSCFSETDRWGCNDSAQEETIESWIF